MVELMYIYGQICMVELIYFHVFVWLNLYAYVFCGHEGISAGIKYLRIAGAGMILCPQWITGTGAGTGFK